jgi:hypothetical protein
VAPDVAIERVPIVIAATLVVFGPLAGPLARRRARRA